MRLNTDPIQLRACIWWSKIKATGWSCSVIIWLHRLLGAELELLVQSFDVGLLVYIDVLACQLAEVLSFWTSLWQAFGPFRLSVEFIDVVLVFMAVILLKPASDFSGFGWVLIAQSFMVDVKLS